jgi:uncharacterized protein (DUF58 family)
MRLTRLGWACLFVLALALMSALSTGNNLLYLLYSALVAALLLSAAAGRWNLWGIRAEGEVPDQVFRGAEFPLRVTLRNGGSWPAFAVSAAVGGTRVLAERLSGGTAARFVVPCRFPHRGLNKIEDAFMESAFPLGLILHRRPLWPGGLIGSALPRVREVHGAVEIKADTSADGRPTLRRGSGDELYGIRDYDPSDDSRSINWKLTAKTGRPLVNEYCQTLDSKVTVRVAGVSGEGAEDRIEEAASACRFFLDAGAEVRLVTPEEIVPHDRGLLQLDKVLRVLARQGEGKVPRPVPAAAARREPPIVDSRALRRLTLFGAALVYAGLFLVDDINPWLLYALAPVIPLGWFIQERGGPTLPDLAWNALSLAVLFNIILVDWPGSGVIIADSHLLVYLLANRCLVPMKREELGQVFLILLLAFFLISGLTISLTYFLLFVLYLAFCGAWLMLAQGLRPEAWRSWTGALAALLALSVGLSAAVFAATPRVEGFRRMNPFIAAGIDKLSVRSSAVM